MKRRVEILGYSMLNGIQEKGLNKNVDIKYKVSWCIIVLGNILV